MPSSPAVERRTQQKQANRQRMIEAASRLFASVGYAGTTMEAVAAGSGMSVQGVYFAFHTKANLLEAAFHQASTAPMSQTAEDDPDRALVAMVEELVRGLEATGPLTLAAAAAAPGDDAAAEIHRRQEERRAQAATDLVQRLRARRPLATGVTVRRCSDVVFGLLSPQLNVLLVRDRGWTQKRYAAWAADAIGRALWG